jgi:Asp-tRNA(Asn)/Glu-tRNA(Gln) amidotransferase A subunit family amidase
VLHLRRRAGRLIRRRALSPVELTRAGLERIERLNGRLGAYVLVHAERALEHARRAEGEAMAGQPLGPLHGVPLSIKDNQLCYPFNYSGQPAISVPAGWTASGLPVGLQIVGRRLEDALVLQAAATFEMLRPWAARRPID